jgi:hypothetical protein
MSEYVDRLPETHEIEVRAGCGHIVSMLNPRGDEIEAMADGPCPGCAMERMDCGFDELEKLIEKRREIFTKYDDRRRRVPAKGNQP